MNKYSINFSSEVVQANKLRLINQLWKLIPMKENNEDWQNHLDVVIIEIVGLKEIFSVNPLFLQLLVKLEGIKSYENIEFSIYRKTIFDCINLLQRMTCDE